MIEQYDVVHIGIVMLLIANDDPRPILKNLIKLLSMLPVNIIAAYLDLTSG